jgi:hypothetical protein
MRKNILSQLKNGYRNPVSLKGGTSLILKDCVIFSGKWDKNDLAPVFSPPLIY